MKTVAKKSAVIGAMGKYLQRSTEILDAATPHFTGIADCKRTATALLFARAGYFNLLKLSTVRIAKSSVLNVDV